MGDKASANKGENSKKKNSFLTPVSYTFYLYTSVAVFRHTGEYQSAMLMVLVQ